MPSRKRPLIHQVAWALAFKLVALAVIYFTFFGPTHRPPVDSAAMAGALLQAPTRSGAGEMKGEK